MGRELEERVDKIDKKEIANALMLTPLFHELNSQEKGNLINYIHSRYGNYSKKSQKGLGKK